MRYGPANPMVRPIYIEGAQPEGAMGVTFRRMMCSNRGSA